MPDFFGRALAARKFRLGRLQAMSPTPISMDGHMEKRRPDFICWYQLKNSREIFTMKSKGVLKGDGPFASLLVFIFWKKFAWPQVFAMEGFVR